MSENNQITELHPNIFWFNGEDPSSHSYLIRGDYKNVLIDSGVDRNFSKLQECLLTLRLKVSDIDIVINTHEHFDHLGANRYFQDYALIAAHRFAATKITVEDRYVTMYKSGDLNEPPLRVHLWLENRFRFDLGNYSLEVVHTPGHTSGSICIYEFTRKLLFTGDTLFAGGTLSYIGESGSVGDYINSISLLETRKINELYPGHGGISLSPEEDMKNAIMNAKALLKNDGQVEVTSFREVS
ncbi:MAG: MBL fold metallo-hydrolase [Proteobacteria bacterium]|nr:MBL fold metallo-hydrolase [Pseudomonadota bacterium]MBU4009897.1 MBL fold metallo-hydrolase [Pseudomonadota bacterium]MBU4036978.1 MBL fold metallo-hydrolase [Pseudomonadota bacterium]